MEVFEKLPVELQQRIFQYLRHPLADLIRDKIAELHLDQTFTIKGLNNKVIIQINCIDYFAKEYFYQRNRSTCAELGSPHSDTSCDFLSEMIFEDLGDVADSE